MPRQNHHDFHLWHASDLWKSTAAINTSNHSPRMQPSNDCSTSSGLEIQKRHGWEPEPHQSWNMRSLALRMCWVTLDSTHLLDSKSNIQSLCMLDGFQDFVIWETHMRLALKLIELCGMRTSTSTRLLGSANVAQGCRYKNVHKWTYLAIGHDSTTLRH